MTTEKIEEISNALCEKMGVGIVKIKGKSRKLHYLYPRYVIYRALRDVGCTLKEIGWYFKKDHTTIISGLQQDKLLRETNDDRYLFFAKHYVNKERNKIYIAGKITGTDMVYTKKLFAKVANQFTLDGYKVFNPMELPHNHDKTWESYMKECIKGLVECEYIHLIEGWQDSKGAVIEANLADTLKIKRL